MSRPRRHRRVDLEARVGGNVIHGWGLEGPGPARFGWWLLHPCSRQYLGRTLSQAHATIDRKVEMRRRCEEEREA